MKETTNMGENRQLDDIKTPVPNVSVETSNAESLASAIDMKDWFSELSIEERVAALSFADGPVLSTFLKLASLSGASTNTHGTHPSHQQQHSAQERTTDKPMKEIESLDAIDWTVHVSWKDVEKTWNELTNPSRRATTSSTPKTKQHLASNTSEKENGKNGSKIESDAFRIRENGEGLASKNNDSIGKKSSASSTRLSQNNSVVPTTQSQLSTKVSELIGNVCIIFPSALQLSTPGAAVGNQPFVTLQPSYLRGVNDEKDFLVTLDEIMGKTIPHNVFLPGQAPPTSWIDLVKKACDHSEKDKATIPLYLLLILRFRISIFDSFHHCTTSGTPNNTPTCKCLIDREESNRSETPSSASTPSTSVNTKKQAVASGSVQRNADNSPEVAAQEGVSKTLDEMSKNVWGICSSPTAEFLTRLDGIAECDLKKLTDAVYSQSPNFSADSLSNCFLSSLLDLLRLVTTSQLSLTETLSSIDNAIFQSITIFNQENQTTLDVAASTVTEPSLDLPAPETEGSKLVTENCHGKISSEGDDKSISEGAKQSDQVVPQAGSGKKKKKKKKNKRKGAGGGQGQQSESGQQVASGNQQGEGEQQDVLTDDTAKEGQKASGGAKDAKVDSRKGGETGIILDTTTSKSTSTSNSEILNENAKIDATESSYVGDRVPETDDGDSLVDEVKTDSSNLDGAPSKSLETQKVEKSNLQVDNKEKKAESSKAPEPEEDDSAKDDFGTWETVEARSRGNRKKAADRTNQGRFPSNQGNNNNFSSSGGQNNNGSKKSKSSRGNKRHRSNNRKFVREILSSVLDSVDQTVRQRRLAKRELPRPSSNKWGPPSTGKGSGVIGKHGKLLEESSNQSKELTMRDVLVGRPTSNSNKAVTGNLPNSSASKMYSDRVRQKSDILAEGKQSPSQPGTGTKNSRDKGDRAAPTAASKIPGTTIADQNTAPTVPETISAISADTPSRNMISQDKGITQGDSSSGDSAERIKPNHGVSLPSKESSPSPPLPTLLSPGNANSATSSVASSLEASHAGHHGNHLSSNLRNENDVGYHLLDVCDRLTRDINIFMKRREHALEIRRRERGSVLIALQETLSSIWPGMCTVEMYGSCATELDLPSSDLDVVVCGLDRPVEPLVSSPPRLGNQNEQSLSREGSKESNQDGSASDNVDIQQLPQNSAPMHQQMHTPMMYGHLSLNAERILRLAMELERQPWAVHVKAIPTASVPVIKILADPTRTSGNGEWLMQHQIGPESSAVSPQSMVEQVEVSGTSPSAMPLYHDQQNPPWRGADVMNGLLKVDITFEGPEHGGIGSTKFSSRVVKEFCDETGQPPEGTPAVQVLMVIKELLAQRRLNEPFSGGLSSYAILLLVISVLRERKFICEELERVERQTRMVTEEGVCSEGGRLFAEKQDRATATKTKKTKQTPKVEETNPKAKPAKNPNAKSEKTTAPVQTKSAKKENGSTEQVKTSSADSPATQQGSSSNAGKKEKALPASSWASIAKKNSSGAPAHKASPESIQSNTIEKKASKQQTKTVRKASSFADAVANGNKGGSKPASVPGPGGAKVKKKETPQNNGNAKNAKAASAPKESGTKNEISPNKNGDESSGVDTHPQQNTQMSASKQNTPVNTSESMISGRGCFPQGLHDVTEVLCSGETTPGKLLMHFLLFYGQHFDSQSTAIDYSGTHQRDANDNNGYSQMSPYMLRRTAGSYDPMTGMLTVDPIVVYDPLEGAETNNVARSCFAWSSIRWVFAQSYLTLLSTVEINQNHSSGQKCVRGTQAKNDGQTSSGSNETPWNGPYGHDKSGNMMIDPSSPLLELLLSF